MASLSRRVVVAAVALLAPTILHGQRARTITVDQARALLGGEFYVVPDLEIIRIEDVSYQCSTTCVTAVRVQQELRPNEIITITEARVPSGITTTEAALSPKRLRTSVNDRSTMRVVLRTREAGDLVLRIRGDLSDGRLASLLNAAEPR